MEEDWKREIATAFFIKQEIWKLDQGRLWGPLYYPELAATEEQVHEVEVSLGFSIPSEYRQFLKCANGWKCFYQETDIFGTDELRRGDQMKAAIETLEWLDANDILIANKYNRNQLLPIGVSRQKENSTLFCITTSAAPRAGVVLWFSEILIQSFLDFKDFFLAMCDYNRLEVDDLMKEQKNGQTEPI